MMVTRILEDVLPKEDSNEAEDSGSGDSADLPENASSDSNIDAADHDPALPEAVELPTQPTDHSDKPL